MGAHEVGAHEVGAPEVGALEVGALEVGAHEVGAHEVGAPEVGAHEVGAPEVGALEVGALEVGAHERYLRPDRHLRGAEFVASIHDWDRCGDVDLDHARPPSKCGCDRRAEIDACAAGYGRIVVESVGLDLRPRFIFESC